MIMYQNGKLISRLYQLVATPWAVRRIETTHFSDRHFWHGGYDKADADEQSGITPGSHEHVPPPLGLHCRDEAHADGQATNKGLVEDTPENDLQARWRCSAGAFGDFADDPAASLACDPGLDLSDAEVGR
jgi:hypothetical protein